MKSETLQQKPFNKKLVMSALKTYQGHMMEISLRERDPRTRTHERVGLTEEARHFVCK